ncbi:MAG: SAM-dependent methyltransferase [Candidatus Kinetoplastibacterium crithidii]|nr:MAG: SAM-dependent methyltransferase [Candidatus Kinetoplastibacterium crithidii]
MQSIISTLLNSLDEYSKHHVRLMKSHLIEQIKQSRDCMISFESWMDEALYAPNLGYYSSKNKIFSSKNQESMKYPAGDFITAPELTSIFTKTLSIQIAEILKKTNTNKILEFGAGTGKLSYDLITELDHMGIKVEYEIIEISSNLTLLQKRTLEPFIKRVKWLKNMPYEFNGCVIANELIDAMPVKLFQWNEHNCLLEKYVGINNKEEFIWINKPANDKLTNTVYSRMEPLPGYASEINLIGEAWLTNIIQNITNGVLLIIDYGFPQEELYHPQRYTGTLMCHLHHIAYSDPFIAPGIQDITAHVNFTALASTALKEKSQILGYTSLARFLLNCNILKILEQMDLSSANKQIEILGPAQKLLSENEMGELFKVLAIGVNWKENEKLIGFRKRDRSEKLFTTLKN